MRNLQRHKVVVGRQGDVDRQDITFYTVDMFVQALKLEDTAVMTKEFMEIVVQDWIKVFCAIDFPQTRIVDGNKILRDWVFWEGKWFAPVEEAKFVKMGGKTYYERYCLWASNVDYSFLPVPPPAFDTEYYPFLDAVGQTTMAVEMAYLPLINKLENL